MSPKISREQAPSRVVSSLQGSWLILGSSPETTYRRQDTFIRETATVLSVPLASTIASWAASASNLLGAVTNGSPVSSATVCAQKYAHHA